MKIEDKVLMDILNESVCETFSSLLNCNPSLVKFGRDQGPDLDDPSNRRFISGSVAFIHGNLAGTVSIGFNRQTALTIFKHFYQQDLNSTEDERITEGVSELANMIHGLVKEKLNQHGYDLKMSLPIVTVGRNHSVFSSIGPSGLAASYQTDLGKVIVELVSHRSEAA